MGIMWHGFVKRKSYLTSLIATYYMPGSVDEKKAADFIFLGFRKAFNTYSPTNLESMD